MATAQPTHIADPEGTLCPECLTPLLVDDDPPGGPRACPQGDYSEDSDSRAPLPSYEDQEATVEEDERLREARAGLGDMRAGSENPAQAKSRIEAWHPQWYAEWLSKQEVPSLPEGQTRGPRLNHPRREVQEAMRSASERTRARAGQPHWRSSDPPVDKDAPEGRRLAEAEARGREAAEREAEAKTAREKADREKAAPRAEKRD